MNIVNKCIKIILLGLKVSDSIILSKNITKMFQNCILEGL